MGNAVSVNDEFGPPAAYEDPSIANKTFDNKTVDDDQTVDDGTIQTTESHSTHRGDTSDSGGETGSRRIGTVLTDTDDRTALTDMAHKETSPRHSPRALPRGPYRDYSTNGEENEERAQLTKPVEEPYNLDYFADEDAEENPMKTTTLPNFTDDAVPKQVDERPLSPSSLRTLPSAPDKLVGRPSSPMTLGGLPPGQPPTSPDSLRVISSTQQTQDHPSSLIFHGAVTSTKKEVDAQPTLPTQSNGQKADGPEILSPESARTRSSNVMAASPASLSSKIQSLLHEVEEQEKHGEVQQSPEATTSLSIKIQNLLREVEEQEKHEKEPQSPEAMASLSTKIQNLLREVEEQQEEHQEEHQEELQEEHQEEHQPTGTSGAKQNQSALADAEVQHQQGEPTPQQTVSPQSQGQQGQETTNEVGGTKVSTVLSGLKESLTLDDGIKENITLQKVDEEEIDLEFVEEYETAFNEFIAASPHFMIENPDLLHNLRIAKLQKVLELLFEVEYNLVDEVKKVETEKNNMEEDYHHTLREAARNKAAREIHLQQELNTIHHATRVMEGKLTWQLVAKTNARAKKQIQMLHQLAARETDSSNLLVLLPDLSETQIVRDAATAPPGTDLSEEQEKDLQQFQVDNAFLNAEVSVLEKKLSYQATRAKKYVWVDSVFAKMDSKRLRKLKHRYQRKLGATFSS